MSHFVLPKKAKDFSLSVIVHDVRPSQKRTGFIPIDQHGIFKIPVKTKQQVDQFLKEALELELRQLGFSIHPEGKIIQLEVSKLLGDLEQTEFRAGPHRIYKHHALGELVVDVTVMDQAQRVLYIKRLQKAIRMRNRQSVFKSTKDTARALNKAIQKLFADLLADDHFILALLQQDK